MQNHVHRRQSVRRLIHLLAIDSDTIRCFFSGLKQQRTRSTGWVGITAGADGKLYSAPGQGSTVLVIDPSNRSCSTVPSSSSESFLGIAAASNGKLFCAPRDASVVLMIESPALIAQVSKAARSDIACFHLQKGPRVTRALFVHRKTTRRPQCSRTRVRLMR